MGQEMKQPEVAQPSVGWGLGLRWATASIVGVLVGVEGAELLFGPVSETSSLSTDFATIALMFTVAGVAQGGVLWRKFSWSGRNFYILWVLASALGGLGSVATAGLTLGIAHWLVLRRHVPRAGWLILASVVGGGVLLFGPTFLGVVLSAVITGGVLVWLLRKPVTEEPSLPQEAA